MWLNLINLSKSRDRSENGLFFKQFWKTLTNTVQSIVVSDQRIRICMLFCREQTSHIFCCLVWRICCNFGDLGKHKKSCSGECVSIQLHQISSDVEYYLSRFLSVMCFHYPLCLYPQPKILPYLFPFFTCPPDASELSVMFSLLTCSPVATQ